MNKSNTTKTNAAARFTELLQKAQAKGITGSRAFNFCAGDIYHGNNAIVLTYIAELYFKGCTAFATFKQIEAIGGSVKGQKGIQILKIVEIPETDDQGNLTGKTKRVPKYYTVFNARQMHRRDLDQAEADLKSGKIKEIDADLYTEIPLPFAEPKKENEPIELIADHAYIEPAPTNKGGKKAKTVKVKTTKKTVKAKTTKTAGKIQTPKKVDYKAPKLPITWGTDADYTVTFNH